MNTRKIEVLAGLFVSFGILALIVLAFQVAAINSTGSGETYQLKAKFDNIGSLKVRAAVKVGGVVIGRVASITLDPEDYLAVVTLDIFKEHSNFSETSSVSVLTQGLLGEQYLGFQPGFIDESVDIMQVGDYIEDTKSALVLEELIGQFLFSVGNDGE
ncbi:MAG: phospholipid/cholesterol/gamma-HCH transport system substrate-binding protein [Alteromonadaceae bacterium]|jgi:phospholipid/cholesterol/gamma-HCH transport system substrate-binding protein